MTGRPAIPFLKPMAQEWVKVWALIPPAALGAFVTAGVRKGRRGG